MARLTSLSLLALFTIACGADAGPSTPNDLPITTATSVTTAAAPPPGASPSTAVTEPAGDLDPQPAYDVFLAAVAEAVADTRFAETPFDTPEVVVSTGLALCEAIDEGFDPDSVVFEYLTDLTEGDPESADDDQLALAGALIGAAEAALCPPGT